MTQTTLEQEEDLNIPGALSARYILREEDRAAWFPAWELKVDRFGEEYGVPTRLPKGQREYYLNKKRPSDGRRRFTEHQPANVLPPGQYECFIGDCHKRVRERWTLVQHIEACHSQEAAAYKPFLDQLRQAIVRDNPRLAALVEGIAGTPEEPPHVVAAVPSSRAEATEPLMATCPDCGWSKASRNPSASLATHRRFRCPGQKEAT